MLTPFAELLIMTIDLMVLVQILEENIKKQKISSEPWP
jgi:hypothetical protein